MSDLLYSHTPTRVGPKPVAGEGARWLNPSQLVGLAATATSERLAPTYWLLATGWWLVATGYWLLASG